MSSLSAGLFRNGVAVPGSAAAGRIDLLSVLVHELGHVAGLDDRTSGVMAGLIAPGRRTVAPQIVRAAPPKPIRASARCRTVLVPGTIRRLHVLIRGGRS